jgi:hypothetical protein
MKLFALAATLCSLPIAAQQSSCTSSTGIWNFDGDYYFVIESQTSDGTLSIWASDPTQPECGKSCGTAASQAHFDPASGKGYALFSGYRVDFTITGSTCTTLQYVESHSCESGTCTGSWIYKKVSTAAASIS